MRRTLLDLEKYYYEVLGEKLQTQPWEQARLLPLFLREGYDFYEATPNGIPLLLAVDTVSQERPPARVAGQLAQVRQRANRHVVYVRGSVTSYNRQRLVRQRLPFLVPGSQIYLPMLCTDLRERFGTPQAARQTVSPATQVLVLDSLLRKDHGPLVPGKCAERLGYTPMTMTRTFRELEMLGVGDHEVRGKNRRLTLPQPGRELWERLSPYLRTPVKRVIYAPEPAAGLNFPAAGETALAKYTMLGDPPTPVVACTASAWKKLKDDLPELPYPEENCVQVELWTYSPETLGGKGVVDQLSLFLSLRDEKDERIAKALDEMMERFPW